MVRESATIALNVLVLVSSHRQDGHMKHLYVISVLAILSAFAVPGKAELMYGLKNTNSLVAFDSAHSSTATSPLAITGLQTNDLLVAIDVRPMNGLLYGLGNLSNLYVINPASGVATQVGSHGGFSLSGTSFAFDFNPVTDRIRVVSDTGQNLRLNPDTGALDVADPNVFYPAGDPNNGATPNIEGAAYSNNFAGAGSTTLYDIDATLLTLVTQDSVTGQLHTVGTLDFAPEVTLQNALGFDVSGTSGIAYAAFNLTGELQTELSIVNLNSGDSAGVNVIGGGFPIIDIAVAGINVVSRKTHGGAGTFSIPMPLVGQSGVEDRVGNDGIASRHTIVISYPISPVGATASVTAHNPPGAMGSLSNVSVSGNDLVVDLTGVSNQQVLTVSTSGGSVRPLTVPIGFLVGDTNGNRSVNSTDVSQTKLQSGIAISNSNFREDVSVGGSINSSDVSQVKLQSGTALP
jgi:uncharacterized protein DUF4394